jgi:hypothetical protein
MDNLEEYLADTLEPAVLRNIEAHLSTCGMCREGIHGMLDVSQLFATLRHDEGEEWEAAPGFYGKVMGQVIQRKSAASFANFFAVNLAFGRRVVFASLLMLTVVGGYLVTHESLHPAGPSPEAILAQQNSPAFDSAQAEDNMLAVTLTAYEH